MQLYNSREKSNISNEKRTQTLETFCSYFLWFSFYSVLGFIYETIFCSINAGKLVERGFLFGPYLPIYGFAAVTILFLLKNESNSLKLFLKSMVLITVLEYITSYVLEVLFDTRWWDYSDYTININGRVSLISTVAFGVFALLLFKVVQPLILAKTDKLSFSKKLFYTRTGLALIISDLILSVVVLLK